MKEIRLNHFPKGSITLLTVLIVGVVTVSITVSLILLGLGASRTSFALQQSGTARALANACSEEALQQIRNSTAYTGTGNLTLGQGTCTYTVTNNGGENRSITSTGTAGSVIRKNSINITTINPIINISSWQEVAN